MSVAPSYKSFTYGQWRLAVLPGYWSEDLQDRVLDLVERQSSSKHPQTVPLQYPNSGRFAYVKVFHPSKRIGNLKDIFRASKALRSLRQCSALAGAGFDVPTTIAAGESRRFWLLRRAFIVTVEIPGQPAPDFLRKHYPANSPGLSLAIKRDSLKRLAQQVRRFHRLGFVHGDLVPSNILISQTDGAGLRFYLMDNDRTRRYPRWFPQSLWRRNLVQLNRFPLPGISLQDRVHFYRCYLGYGELRSVDRRLLRWLEKKTRQRRKECDAVDPNVDFRKLMRWEERTASGF
jgi:serine/threonine protein kinase